MTLPLILLPGMMCDARLFAHQSGPISALGPLLVADIGGADSVAALAAAIWADAPPRVALAGLSMGGIVAMEMLRQAPARVAGLALMDTNPLAEADAVKARRAPQIAKVQAGQLDAVMRDEMKPNYLTEGPMCDEILELCMDMALGLGPEVFCRQSVALRERPDQSETLAAYRGHALVLCGRDDALCPVARHKLMHALMPQSRLVIIEDAGHLPVLEQPDETTATLVCWRKEIENG